MTRLEIANVLNDIMIENNFSIIDRDNCHEKYSDKINSMQEIFHLKSSSDFTYLYAVSHLLSDKEKSVDDYLLNENKDSTFVKDIKLPTREDMLLVATSFEENPEFFSMAWNWVVITEDRLNIICLFNSEADMFNKKQLDLDYPVYASAAGVPGFNNITRIPIDLLGELEIRGNSETKRLIFVLFVNPNYETLKFEMKIKFEIENEENTAIIKKDYSESSKQISSQALHVSFSRGFRITKIEWTVL